MAKTIKFVTEAVSPYKLAEHLNEALAAAGIDKTVVPQQIYQATRQDEEGNARLATTRTETGKQLVSVDDGNAFIDEYIARLQERMAKAEAKAAEEAVEVDA